MKVTQGERLRMELLVRGVAPWPDLAHVRHVLEDVGFDSVVVNVAQAGDRVELPDWIALAEGTWPEASAELADELGDVRVRRSVRAPVQPGGAPPPAPTPGASWATGAAVVLAIAGVLWWVRR